MSPAPVETTATLLDWAWVEMMVTQAMVGVLPPEVCAVGLSEKANEWVVAFFLRRPVDPDVQRELFEVAGDAELYLSQSPAEPVPTTLAILKPIRSVIVDGGGLPIAAIGESVDRLLMALRPSVKE